MKLMMGKKLWKHLLENGITEDRLKQIEKDTEIQVREDFEKALAAEDPKPKDATKHIFAPTPVTEEKGVRNPENGQKIVMVDLALYMRLRN